MSCWRVARSSWWELILDCQVWKAMKWKESDQSQWSLRSLISQCLEYRYTKTKINIFKNCHEIVVFLNKFYVNKHRCDTWKLLRRADTRHYHGCVTLLRAEVRRVPKFPHFNSNNWKFNFTLLTSAVNMSLALPSVIHAHTQGTVWYSRLSVFHLHQRHQRRERQSNPSTLFTYS